MEKLQYSNSPSQGFSFHYVNDPAGRALCRRDYRSHSLGVAQQSSHCALTQKLPVSVLGILGGIVFEHIGPEHRFEPDCHALFV